MDPFENYGKEISLDVKKKDIITLNNPHIFHKEHNGKLSLEDGIHCDYKNKLVKAKMVEICLCLAPLVDKLDFRETDCLEMQKEAIRRIRSCLNIVTFQIGVDRSRLARSDCVGRLAVNGQGHCHGVSSTMAAFLLPVAPLLGIDLKYRGCFTFGSDNVGKANNVERHQCLEVSLRPAGKSFVVDLWLAEKYNNPSWLCMDFNTAYNRFMYPNGAFILKTRPSEEKNFDFCNEEIVFK
eukprot:GFUD01016516.1.p1 GENE.GFUD01016516.1~~GFUD01016516.1.p1  ORF type:complete len:264 (+),score=59.42 GFUD01016516.1:79-792(+)